jgi:copper(I)-binding protein
MGVHPFRTAAALVALSGVLLGGCGKLPREKAAADGIAVSGAVLVTPKTGAGSLSAKVVNRSGRDDEIVGVSAMHGSTKLFVFQGGGGGWELLPAGRGRALGPAIHGEPFVVRGIEPGQTVQLTIRFKHATPVTLKVPVVEDGPQYSTIFAYPLPTISNGRIVVRSSSPCAYVGYTIVSNGGVQRTMPADVVAVGPDGKKVAWKHQSATGGPGDIVATEEPRVVEPAADDAGCEGRGQGGDADYVDAAAVTVGQTVEVEFEFPAGLVRVPFHVMAG